MLPEKDRTVKRPDAILSGRNRCDRHSIRAGGDGINQAGKQLMRE